MGRAGLFVLNFIRRALSRIPMYIYGTARWKRLRASVLAKDCICVLCRSRAPTRGGIQAGADDRLRHRRRPLPGRKETPPRGERVVSTDGECVPVGVLPLRVVMAVTERGIRCSGRRVRQTGIRCHFAPGMPHGVSLGEGDASSGRGLRRAPRRRILSAEVHH